MPAYALSNLWTSSTRRSTLDLDRREFEFDVMGDQADEKACLSCGRQAWGRGSQKLMHIWTEGRGEAGGVFCNWEHLASWVNRGEPSFRCDEDGAGNDDRLVFGLAFAASVSMLGCAVFGAVSLANMIF